MSNLTDHALAEIRQLCSLGLALTAIAPELAQALLAYVPGEQVIFFLQDSLGRPVRALFSNRAPPDDLADCLDDVEGYLALERALGIDGTDFLRSGRLFQNPGSCEANFAGSALYQRILAPMGIHAVLRMAIRHDGAGLGLVALARPPGEPFYTAREEERLAVVQPCLAAAMASPQTATADAWDGEEGVLVIDRGGTVQHLCGMARLLRDMIVHPHGTGGENRRQLWESELRSAAGELAEVYRGGPLPDPPVWRHVNPHGRFELRVFPLISTALADSFAIVRLKRFCPAAVRIVCRLSRYQLSPRQRDVALLLAQGQLNRAISAHLGVRPNTVAGLVRDIYHRVGVNSRLELREVLLGCGTADHARVVATAFEA